MIWSQFQKLYRSILGELTERQYSVVVLLVLQCFSVDVVKRAYSKTDILSTYQR